MSNWNDQTDEWGTPNPSPNYRPNTYQDPRHEQTGNRVSVGQFWAQSILFGIMIIAGIALIWGGIQLRDTGDLGMWGMWGIILIMGGFGGNFEITQKRFHDLNLSGWMALTLMIPYLQIIPCIMLLFVPGTNGPNNYGQKP